MVALSGRAGRDSSLGNGVLTDIAGRTGGGVVALSGRAGRDSSLGNGVLTDITGRTGRGAVALSGRAGRDSSLGNGGKFGLNNDGMGCEKGLD